MRRPRRRYQLDGERLGDLYFVHAGAIFAYLFRRTVDRDVALDLLGETFAEAFEDRRSFRGRSSEDALAWVYGIARHQLANYYRRGHAEQRALRRLGVELGPWEDPEIERIEELAGIAPIREALRVRMAGLPRGQQEAVELRVIEEYSYEEVAAELGLSEQTVRMRVSRALRTLAAEVAEDSHAGEKTR
jgi:RNA polymerase sigma factor (sigma-70 family)